MQETTTVILNRIYDNQTEFRLQTHPTPDLITDDVYDIILKILTCERALVSFLGIFTNALNVAIFIRMGIEDSVSLGFFTLSLFDLFGASFSLAYVASRVLLFIAQDYKIWLRINPFYISIYFVLSQNTMYQVSMFITAFLALQRSLCVLLPMRFKSIFTRFRSFVILTMLWVLVLAFYIPFITRFRLTEVTDPAKNSSYIIMTYGTGFYEMSMFLNIGLSVSLNIVCQAVILACVFIMKYVLTKSLDFRRSVASGQKNDEISKEGLEKMPSNTKERSAIMQVTVVSIVFLATNMPNIVLALTYAILPDFGLRGGYPNLASVCNNIRIAIEICNPCANFFIYYKYNSNFKKHALFIKPNSKS